MQVILNEDEWKAHQNATIKLSELVNSKLEAAKAVVASCERHHPFGDRVIPQKTVQKIFDGMDRLKLPAP